MADFAPALRHGPITEVFPNVFMVTGSFRFNPVTLVTRNMTIVRQGTELAIINSVRLTPAGEAELEKLGRVKHLLRIGAFHGADDPYYKDRYQPALWAPDGIRHKGELHTDQELRPGATPIAGSTVFRFEKARQSEVAMLLEGGVLVACDSYQNWTTYDGCSFLAKMLMPVLGFGPTTIGGPWLKTMGPEVRADFERLMTLDWKHVIPGHGTVLKDKAKEGLTTAMNKARFG
jgi:hypothetical protein